MEHYRLTEEIPVYLEPYIVKQDPSLYTPMDHASWRYILKISRSFFAKHAHQKYLDGLRETGISTERIPLIEEMDACLKVFNWHAVAVSGFIPPAVFMEFLSLGILPIACDMRTLDHLAYTPAPDIVHEAAGHAPIIADPEYSSYLRSYGDISRKAIFSSEDMDVYHAIRFLSDIKEDPRSTEEEIEIAQDKLDQAVASVTYTTEATLLSRMAWWTFEYGMVGNFEKPKIYGAGLLSSIGESYHCFSPYVKKIPFSIDCVQTSYDITRPQPQLFVAPNFQILKDVLGELANHMAFRTGGIEGLKKAKQARTVTTTELDSGVQISGICSEFYTDQSGRCCYVRWTGPTQLAFRDKEIDGQGAGYHQQGYSSTIEEITEDQLTEAGFAPDKKGRISFSSGISIEGELVGEVRKEGRLVLLTFKNCTVSRDNEILFRPEWGNFDVICGKQVVSVFGGSADRTKYLGATGGFREVPGRQKTNLTDENKKLNELYLQIRALRDSLAPTLLTPAVTSSLTQKLTEVFENLEKNYSRDWLLPYEILELVLKYKLEVPWETRLWARLSEISKESTEKTETIQRGLELL